WISLDEEKNVKEPKGRPAREWWKEEYCDKLVRKRKKNKKKQGRDSSTHNLNTNNWWQKDDEMYVDNRKKKRSRSTGRGSRGSVDWWSDGFSAMIQQPRIPSSRLMTCSDVLIRVNKPQFRYTKTPLKVLHLRNFAWECTEEELIELGKPFGKVVNTKCNIGANRNQAFIEFPQFRYTKTPLKVLHLRNLPWECTEEELIVLGKPFGKVVNTKCIIGANRNQAFIEFSEQNQAIAMISYFASSSEPAQDLDKEQALVCITVAFLCLKKPALQPSMKEIVAMLSGPIYAEQRLKAFQMLGQLGLAVKI
nr:polypyrimidine tract-binding protein homolog 2-like isoform X1 [Tanacetum cinerariifolium]